MPKIAEIKTDDNGCVWCNIGRLGAAQGSVMVLTEEEYNNMRFRERQRMLDIFSHVVANLEKHEELMYALPR